MRNQENHPPAPRRTTTTTTRRRKRFSAMSLTTEGRECGGCTECCKLLAVCERGEVDGKPYEWAKPAYEWCQHCEIGVGCRVYDQPIPVKADACNTFKCLWLDGLLLDSQRPDRSGVVVFMQAINAKTGESVPHTAQMDPRDSLAIWVVYEYRPLATRDAGSEAREILEFLRNGDYPVLVIHGRHKDRTIYWPGREGMRAEFTGDYKDPRA